MPSTNEPRQREVRVFISSTFRDMHAERDHLVTVVFPELRERVEKLGLEFFDVDLRWGVPEKNADGEKANSWEYCRQWIDRVEPFFVCILGQRYGWIPAAGDFKSDEDKLRQESELRSITDLEVRHAVLDDRKKRRSYFYLRETTAPATATEYVDPPPLSAKLELLKKEVRSCNRPVRDYPCEWTGSAFTEMDEFGRLVLEDLWSGVLRDERYVSKAVWLQVLATNPDTDLRYIDESEPVPRELWEKIISLATPEPKDPLDAERKQMAAFASARLRWFQGRTEELGKLMVFIRATDENAPRLAVVAAEPGQGKSALLAKLSTLISDALNVSITHFVGATERSSSSQALVERLLDELDRSGIAWPPDLQERDQKPKRDFNSMCLRFASRLRDYAGERRLVIVLDALNQLSDGHDLQWLPTQLGPRVRVIVSCAEDTTANSDGPEQRVVHALAARQPAQLRVPLGPLTEHDVRTMVTAYLKEYCHELDREHLDALCTTTQARNPLYLLVMVNELRTLGGNDLNRIVPARIAAMARDYPDTVSLFRWALQRLEVFGPEAVRWWCLYLSYGRVGMASHELSDLLARKLGANAAATALRIERGMRGYLQRRGLQLDFFHSQLRQAVTEEYGLRVEISMVHSDIATYFRDLADPNGNHYWKGTSEQREWQSRLARPLSEIVYHFSRAGAWDRVTAILCDLRFVESRFLSDTPYGLLNDYQTAMAALSDTARDFHEQEHGAARRKEFVRELVGYAAASRVTDSESRKCPALSSLLPLSEDGKSDRTIRADSARRTDDCVLAFYSFVRSQFELLRQYCGTEGFVGQQAVNCGENSPVNQAGSAIRQTCLSTPSFLSRHIGMTPGEVARSETFPLLSQVISISDELPANLNHIRLDRVPLAASADFHRAVVLTGRMAGLGSGPVRLSGWDIASRSMTWETVVCPSTSWIWVTVLSANSDGSIVAAGLSDGAISVLDGSTGKLLRQIVPDDAVPLRDRGRTLGLALTADGMEALAIQEAAGQPSRVWKCDLTSGIVKFQTRSEGCVACDLSADGSVGIVADRAGGLHVRCFRTGEIRYEKGHKNGVTSCALTPNGHVAITADDSDLCVWNVAIAQIERRFELGEPVRSVKITPDGRQALLMGIGTCIVIALDNGRILKALPTSREDGAIICDGTFAMTSGDGKLEVWNLNRGTQGSTTWRLAEELKQRTARAKRLRPFWRSGTYLGRRVDAGHTLGFISGHGVEVRGEIGVLSEDGESHILDLLTGERKEVDLPGGSAYISGRRSSTDMSSDRRHLVIADSNHMTVCRSSGETVVHVANNYPCRFTPDCAAVVVGIDPLEVISLSSGTVLRKLSKLGLGDRRYDQTFHLTENGRYFLATAWPGPFTLVGDLETGVIDRLSDLGKVLACATDGRLCVSVEYGTTRILLWDLRTGELLARRIFDLKDPPFQAKFSPDGRRIALFDGQNLGEVSIVDSRSGEMISVLPLHGWRVERVWFTNTGRYLITEDHGLVRAWDIMQGRCVAVLPRNGCKSGFQDPVLLTATNLDDPEVFELKSGETSRAPTTASRVWLFNLQEGSWDDKLAAPCPSCGFRMEVPAFALGRIAYWSSNAVPGVPPIMGTEDRAWLDPSLEHSCSSCGRQIRFNPFCCDQHPRGNSLN